MNPKQDKARRKNYSRSGESLLHERSRLRKKKRWSDEFERKFRRTATKLIRSWETDGSNTFQREIRMVGDYEIPRDGKAPFFFDAFELWWPGNFKPAFESGLLRESQNRLFIEIFSHTTQKDITDGWDVIAEQHERTFGRQPRVRGKDDGWAKSFERFLRFEIRGMSYKTIAAVEIQEGTKRSVKVGSDLDRQKSEVSHETVVKALAGRIKSDVGRFRQYLKT